LKNVINSISKIGYFIPYFQGILSIKYKPDLKKDIVISSDWNKDFILGIVLNDNSIYMFDMINEKWKEQVLRHDFQRGITKIKWRPNSSHQLAVSCKYGVLLWDITKRMG
jgi:hypothetical protein